MGRFISPDWSASVAPIPYVELDDPQSLNLYTYVGNRPVSSIDPDGHTCSDGSTQCWLEEHAALVAEAEKDIEKSWSGTVGKINKAAGKLTGIGEFNLKNSGDRSALANTLGSAFNNFMAVVVPAIASDGLSLEGELGAAAGETAAEEAAVTSEEATTLQSGGNSITKLTAKGLNEATGENLTKREWGRALEELKKDTGLTNDTHGKIMNNGDHKVNGDVVGNLTE